MITENKKKLKPNEKVIYLLVCYLAQKQKPVTSKQIQKFADIHINHCWNYLKQLEEKKYIQKIKGGFLPNVEL